MSSNFILPFPQISYVSFIPFGLFLGFKSYCAHMVNLAILFACGMRPKSVEYPFSFRQIKMASIYTIPKGWMNSTMS